MDNVDNQLDAPSSNVQSSNLVRSEDICSLTHCNFSLLAFFMSFFDFDLMIVNSFLSISNDVFSFYNMVDKRSCHLFRSGELNVRYFLMELLFKAHPF